MNSTSTPEERLAKPLKWEPVDPSGESIKQLEVILGVAVANDMMSDRDAERMLRIIQTNPCSRIARMGQRLTILESVAKDLHNISSRLDEAIKQEKISIDQLNYICREHWTYDE